MFGLINTAYAAEDGISVHLAPTIVGYIGNLPITATLITAWVAMLIIGFFAIFMWSRMTIIPSKLQSLLELLI